MSNLINKVKDAVSGHNDHHHTDNAERTAGPHGTDSANRIDPRVDSDMDGSRTYGDNSGMNTTGSTNAGPHNSNVANKIDPRVDSDLDGNRASGNTGTYGDRTGYGSNTDTAFGSNTFGSTTDNYGSNTGTGLGGSNAGPHNSNVANKLDPRVDSTTGNTGYGSNTGTGYGSNTDTGYGSNTGTGFGSNTDTGYGSNTGTGFGSNNDTTYGSNTGTGYGSNTGTAGPHNSNVANKLDPRVDSDMDGSRRTGNTDTYGSDNYGSNTGTGYGNTGPEFGSNTGSGLGSTTDSSIGARKTTGVDGAGFTAHSGNDPLGPPTGTGPDNVTRVPHKSNLLNKLDPRVDSNTDSSRNFENNNSGTGSYE